MAVICKHHPGTNHSDLKASRKCVEVRVRLSGGYVSAKIVWIVFFQSVWVSVSCAGTG